MNRMCAGPNCLFWSHAAGLSHVDEVCARAVRFLETYSLAGDDRFAVLLLLREALTNAVVHGCQEDERLNVIGWLYVRCGEIVIEVIDQGRGFPWLRMPAEIPESLSETGRGLAIYRLYATTYQFNHEGNRVTLRRTLRTSPSPALPLRGTEREGEDRVPPLLRSTEREGEDCVPPPLRSTERGPGGEVVLCDHESQKGEEHGCTE